MSSFFFWLLLRFFFVFMTDFKLFNYDMPWCGSFHLSCAWAFFSFLEFWVYSFFNHIWKFFATISSEYFPVLPPFFSSSGISVTYIMYIQPLEVVSQLSNVLFIFFSVFYHFIWVVSSAIASGSVIICSAISILFLFPVNMFLISELWFSSL